MILQQHHTKCFHKILLQHCVFISFAFFVQISNDKPPFKYILFIANKIKRHICECTILILFVCGDPSDSTSNITESILFDNYDRSCQTVESSNTNNCCTTCILIKSKIIGILCMIDVIDGIASAFVTIISMKKQKQSKKQQKSVTDTRNKTLSPEYFWISDHYLWIMNFFWN